MATSPADISDADAVPSAAQREARDDRIMALNVRAYACASGRSVDVRLLDDAGGRLDFASISPGVTQPAYTLNGSGPVALPPVAILSGTANFGFWPLPQSTRFLGGPDPSVRALKCGAGNFQHGNAGGAEGWAALGLSPPSWSGRPFLSTAAGDLLNWTVEGFQSLDAFDLYARWPTDPTLTTAQFLAIDGSGVTRGSWAADQSVATPSDRVVDAYPFQRLGSFANVAGNQKFTLRIVNPGGGKVAIDGMYLVRTSPDTSVLFAPTDVLTLVLADGWATYKLPGGGTAPVPGGAYPVINAVGGYTGQPIDPARVRMIVGLNVEPDGIMQASTGRTNLARRVALPLAGAATSDPVHYWPLTLSAPSLAGILVATPPPDSHAYGKLANSLQNGLCTVRWTGPDTYVLGAGQNTTCVERLDLRAANSRTYDIRAVAQLQLAPSITLGLISAGPASVDGTWPWSSSPPTINPPDPADAAGTTAWAGPPAWHPSDSAKEDPAGILRFLDNLGSNSNFIRELGGPDRNTVDVAVLRIEDPGVADPYFDYKNWTVVKITTSGPHGLFEGAMFSLVNCGVAHQVKTSDPAAFGPDLDLASGPIGGQMMAHVEGLPDNILYAQISQTGGQFHLTAPLAPASGRLHAVWLGNIPFQSYIDRLRAGTGRHVELNLPTCASRACVEGMATLLADPATGLRAGFQVWMEDSNEAWNEFVQGAYFQTLAYRWKIANGIANPDDRDYGAGYVADAATKWGWFEGAWVAAGRHVSDLVRVLGTAGGNPGQVTNDLIGWAHAMGVRVDSVAVGDYTEADFYGVPGGGRNTALDPIYAAMTHEQDLDFWELLIPYGGFADLFFGANRAILDAYGAEFAATTLCAYEGNWEYVTAGTTLANNWERTQAILADPRAYRIFLGWLQAKQDAGCVMACLFQVYSAGFVDYFGRLAAWPIYTGWNQQPGSGFSAENPDPFDLASLVSQRGGALNQWESWRRANLAPPAPATSFTVSGPTTGAVGVASGLFVVAVDGTYTGTITTTPSGGGLSAPIVLDWAGDASSRTFRITPTAAGVVTLSSVAAPALAPAPALHYAATAAGGGGGSTPVAVPIRRVRGFERIGLG